MKTKLAIALVVICAAYSTALAKKKPATKPAPAPAAPVAPTPPPAPEPPPPPPAAPETLAPSLSNDNIVVAAPPSKPERGAFIVGVKVGGLFPQVFSSLGASFLVDVEVGYALPFLKRSFHLLLDAGYTQPEKTGTQMDPRVTSNGGSYSWHLVQREVLLGLTLMWRAPFIMDGKLGPYIGFGPRMWLNQSTIVGNEGKESPIQQSTEPSMKFGLGVPLGVDYTLGPGRLFVEAMLLWAPIDHRITGESSVGSLTVTAGYRVVIGI